MLAGCWIDRKLARDEDEPVVNRGLRVMPARLRSVRGVNSLDLHAAQDITPQRRTKAQMYVFGLWRLFWKGTFFGDAFCLLKVAVFVDDDDPVCVHQAVSDRAEGR